MRETLKRIPGWARRGGWDDPGTTVLAFLVIGGYLLSLPWVSVVAGLAILVVIGWSQSRMLRWSGRFIACRTVLIAALATFAAVNGDGPGTFFAVIAVGIGVVLETLSRDPLLALGRARFANTETPFVWNKGTAISRTVFTLNVAAMIAAIAGVLAQSDVVIGIAALVSIAASGILLLRVRFLSLREQRLRRIDREFIKNTYKAVFVLHWDGPIGGTYQLAMWLPYLEELQMPYVIATRNRASVDIFKDLTDKPVVWCRDSSDVELVLTEHVRAVVYVNTALKNLHFMRFTNLTHIQLNHGDSDKAASVSKVFRMFDYNFVAGQAAIDRFRTADVDVRQGHMRIVGRPQVSNITRRDGNDMCSTVLYAPTWGGYFSESNYASLPEILPIIESLLRRGKRIVFRPHPLTARHPEHVQAMRRIEKLLRDDEARTGTEHIYGTAATEQLTMTDCINVSDAMIADVSSVVTDYLFSEKPLLMVRAVDEDEFVRDFPVARYAYLLPAGPASDAERVEQLLDDALGPDTMRGERLRGREYYLGPFDAEHYTETFYAELTSAIEGTA